MRRRLTLAILSVTVVLLAIGCATPTIRVSVLYPNEPGKHFDFDYYRDSHMAMVKELLTKYGLIEYGIDRGIAGGEPGQPAPFICIAWMTFRTLEGFQQGFAANAEPLFGDVPNFTDIAPIVQISDIVK